MIRVLLKKVLIISCILAFSASAFSSSGFKRKIKFEKVDKAAMDSRYLTLKGKLALKMPGMKWKHAQTDHFVLHYEKTSFAKKVARMAEFFYQYIPADLGGDMVDHVNGRSHIFIFDKPEKWRRFRSNVADVDDWSFSFVERTGMYLQKKDDTKGSGNVLAHEMTHLVFNRFFNETPPLWLNEGLAEWYGLFAYAAFKGVKKSRRIMFDKKTYSMPVSELVILTRYPSGASQAQKFYETARWFIGFLRMEWPPEKFNRFMHDCLEGESTTKALKKNFNKKKISDFQPGFDKFIRKRARNR